MPKGLDRAELSWDIATEIVDELKRTTLENARISKEVQHEEKICFADEVE